LAHELEEEEMSTQDWTQCQEMTALPKNKLYSGYHNGTEEGDQ